MSRSFTAGWVPEAVVLRGSGQADPGLWHTVLLGSIKGNFSSDLGQFDLEAESHSSGISEECVCIPDVVFGVKTADPTAWECLSSWWWPLCQAMCLVQLPELQRVNGGGIYNILHHSKRTKKWYNSIHSPCLHTLMVFSHSIPYPPLPPIVPTPGLEFLASASFKKWKSSSQTTRCSFFIVKKSS